MKDGEILVLLGSSGSGKTTLMKMINQLIEQLIEPTRK
ncbi:ATP-binding cassette domain-containing protein [Candidatus Coxiella mudrowiae]|nr:ATP-binding cassette domain-containing protein [Candidatus Coxiella mudrowiae]